MSSRSLVDRAAALEAANAAATVRSRRAASAADAALASVRSVSSITVNEAENEDDDDDNDVVALPENPKELSKEPSFSSNARGSSQANWKETIQSPSPRRHSRVLGERPPSLTSSLNRPVAASSKSMSEICDEHVSTSIADLQDAINKLAALNRTTESAIGAMLEQIDKLQADHKDLKRKAVQTTTVLEKQKQSQMSHEAKYLEAEADLASKTFALDDAKRSEAKAAQAAKAIEIRLERALHDLEKSKRELRDERATKGGPAVPRIDHDKVLRDAKRAEKQKAELLVAYKKQAKLIEVLKRQKIHLEAAKDLELTEAEFVKTVDLGNL
ncbi:hypothetical protein SPRG_19329 [Saprolegnia parasitica CBS 223.65]|uniref:Testis expressed 9 n=1 Tax=Saprolegnia parasitica (strain CBS 223.65) TaxID=695850 RepID=A0A067CSR9_SAPPC|nr:hypothetical protein SPRG_19329 [Saprolegnia parasitica CBS 223.65]KDO33719.1 hypothetical protein SPRG_19329 [Saprolegnia parasitica CBS 223.65]|eukprot:XP_012195740.1 hypothetical protein SPRG_19329 [Saprolegnia parasitica CBS 223.65]